MLSYDIYFSLSYLLNMIISRASHIAYKWHYFIPFYGWVIFHHMYVSNLFLFICQWTLRLNSSIIYNWQNMETTQVPICINVDGLGRYYVGWNKSYRKRQILYITYIWNIKIQQAGEYNKTETDSQTENKLVIISGEREGKGTI